MPLNLSGTAGNICSSYKNWVCANPKQAGDVEAFAKWVSYFIAGRVNDSNIPSELVYSLSNLLVFFNDRIIQKARHEAPTKTLDTLKTWLTVVEYVEVFIEISARRLWGEKARWIIVVCVQILKCLGRLLLVFRYKEQITQMPPIPPLKRDCLVDVAEHNEKLQIQSASFTLKRSGRIIRRVEMAPPIHTRAWKPLKLPVTSNENRLSKDESVKPVQKIAECLYIVKPLLHLCSMSVSGEKAWKPWLLCLAVDIASLHMHQRNCPKSSLPQHQQLELSRRLIAFTLYALRSPFYDRYTKDRLLRALHCLSRSVPLVGKFISPLVHYLPVWQDTYFYIWST